MLKLIYIFGHVLIVNSRCYGRCYVKNLIPLSTFLNFHTHVEENSIRSFQKVFDKSSRVLILAFPRNCIFHGLRHILGYKTTLSVKCTSPFCDLGAKCVEVVQSCACERRCYRISHNEAFEVQHSNSSETKVNRAYLNSIAGKFTIESESPLNRERH